MATTAIPVSKPRRKLGPPSCFISCFGASRVLSSADGESSAATAGPKNSVRSWWSRFGRTKKTVPVDVAGNSTGKEKTKKKSERKSLFKLFQKDKSSNAHNSTNPQHPQQPGAHGPQVHQVTSKNSTQPNPSVLHRMPDRTQIGTMKSYRSSPEPASSPARPRRTPRASFRKKSLMRRLEKSGSILGLLLIITVILALLLLFPCRISATLCICTLFYLLPHVRKPLSTPTTTTTTTSLAVTCSKGKEEDAGHVVMDTSSKEYKKMVVLSGLLERDGRTTPRRPM